MSILKHRPEAIELSDWEKLTENGASVWAVGSRTISGASKPDSDFDFLVLTSRPIPDAIQNLDYELEVGDKHYEPSDGAFNSWRKGRINLIATYDRRFARNFLIANSVAQELGIKDRKDRVTLFQAIRYSKSPRPVFPLLSQMSDTGDEIPF